MREYIDRTENNDSLISTTQRYFGKLTDIEAMRRRCELGEIPLIS
jgi:hypothetical protein